MRKFAHVGGNESPAVAAPLPANDLTCEICGSQMLQRQCKITCPNCGFTRDCSDP